MTDLSDWLDPLLSLAQVAILNGKIDLYCDFIGDKIARIINVWVILNLLAMESRFYRPTIYHDIFEIKIAINGDLISILSTQIDRDFIKPKIAMRSGIITKYRNF